MVKTRDIEGASDASAPNARRFLALLQGLEEKDDAEAEWRQLENQWLTAVLRQTVIAFDDVQIAAELMARHRWEDSGSGSPHGRIAFFRLHQLRHRRGMRDALESWTSDR